VLQGIFELQEQAAVADHAVAFLQTVRNFGAAVRARANFY